MWDFNCTVLILGPKNTDSDRTLGRLEARPSSALQILTAVKSVHAGNKTITIKMCSLLKANNALHEISELTVFLFFFFGLDIESENCTLHKAETMQRNISMFNT